MSVAGQSRMTREVSAGAAGRILNSNKIKIEQKTVFVAVKTREHNFLSKKLRKLICHKNWIKQYASSQRKKEE